MKKSYNKILMSILAVFMPIMSYAHDVEIGEIFYNLDNNSKEATVTYKGSNPDNEDYTRFVVIPSTITHNGTKYSVTGIGACAFNNCLRLRAVAIPNSVKSIGDKAFAKCNGLTSFTIPESVTSIGKKAFYLCTDINSINIPNSVQSIGSHAFFGCSSLTSITIPYSVTCIGDSTFYECM